MSYLTTLQGKILFWSGISLIITILILSGMSTYSLRSNSLSAAQLHAAESAKNYAGRIKSQIDVAMDAARTLSQGLSGIKDTEKPLIIDREGVNNILLNTLKGNSDFLGVYVGWEPNAFDGVDDAYVNTPGNDDTGRFLPYWNRGAQGTIAVEPLVDVDAEDYYNLPKQKRAEVIIDPYLYMVQGKETLLTSLVVPIMSNGEFYGIAGVDLGLDFLQELANEIDLYNGTARLAIISNSGLLAGVTGSPQLIGENASKFFTDLPMSTIHDGMDFIRESDGNLEVYVPLQVGRNTTPWSTCIIIPMTQITAKSTALMIRQIILGLLCIIGAGIILWFVARSISRPIYRVIDGLNTGALQVTDASQQVSTSSQHMAEGASEQASSLEEISSSLEEMTSMTKQNSSNAAKANDMSKQSVESANTGTEAMNRMLEAINEIKISSDETAKIIKTIDEIAFQTNLLALNAAVEAARAGDAGMGFAVVAEEVRNLAQRSAEAAKTTSSLIEESQQNADNGVKVSEDVATILKNIAETVEKSMHIIGEVSAASNEQAQGIAQVAIAINQMDQATQSFAANSEESASASEELTAQANELNEMVHSLVTIVGGNTDSQISASLSERSVSHKKSVRITAIKQLGASHKKTAPETVKVKDVIPLDDMESF